jgi:hypothetical protein
MLGARPKTKETDRAAEKCATTAIARCPLKGNWVTAIAYQALLQQDMRSGSQLHILIKIW